MPKFSIITPSYNSWKYMSKYLESLEKQTYQNFEVIIVDDCSLDDTFIKISEYAEKSFLNIKVLQNSENHGPGYTRNRGMEEATGEWITFVDSDDSIDPFLLEKAISVIDGNYNQGYPINCIVYDYNIVKGEQVRIASSMYGNHIRGVQSIPTCIAMVRNHVIGKIYRAERVKKIKFPELKRCEDVAFVCQAIDVCCMEGKNQIGDVYYLKEALYYYEQRSSSLSNDKFLDETDMIKAHQIIKDKLGEKYPKEICTKAVPDLLYGGVLMMCKSRKSARDIRNYISDFEKQYPNWHRNRILKELGKTKLIFLICIKYRKISVLKMLTRIHSKMTG